MNMILLCKALYRAFAVFVQSSLQVVCHAGVQDSISFVGQKVDIILFHILTAFLGVEFAEAFLLSERVLRDCHVGLRPPRNDKSEGHCGQRCYSATCQPARRSLSAATFFSRAAALCSERRCRPRRDRFPLYRRPVRVGSIAPGPAVRSPAACFAVLFRQNYELFAKR